jgi:hypothetical protein
VDIIILVASCFLSWLEILFFKVSVEESAVFLMVSCY